MAYGRRAMLCLSSMLLVSCAPHIDDDAALNDIYRAFFQTPIDTDSIERLYRDDVIHVGRPETPLLSGRGDFMEAAILPLAEVVNSGQLEVSGKAFIMRRLIVGDMANDVGYLYAMLRQSDGEPIEQLQKISWVFVKEGGAWRVVTDFDGTPAPLDLIAGLQPQFTIE